MGIKDILVHLDNSAAAATRLDVAILYARKHGAHLRGLYLITHYYYEPRSIIEKIDREKTEQMFASKTNNADIDSEWVFQDNSVMGSNISDLVTMYAYYTDLVILGQTDTAAPATHTQLDLAERVSLTSGRPVLIVPYTGSFQYAGARIMIAWKAGRESIRALNDALPHLHVANNVNIIEIETADIGESTSLKNAQIFLDKHGIQSTTELINAGNCPIGDMILNNVCEKKIDLLVMGAFSPKRSGALELSQVARHIIKHMTVPVLIAH